MQAGRPADAWHSVSETATITAQRWPPAARTHPDGQHVQSSMSARLRVRFITAVRGLSWPSWVNLARQGPSAPRSQSGPNCSLGDHSSWPSGRPSEKLGPAMLAFASKPFLLRLL